MGRKIKRKNSNNKKIENVNQYTKFIDMLDDYLSEGYTVRESLSKLNSFIGKNRLKFNSNKILKEYTKRKKLFY